jgi:acyl-CoA hydrolase
VVVTAPPASGAVTISPTSASLSVNATQKFTATVGGVPSGAAWTVQEGTSGGSISSGGLYTAPATGGIFHVVAANPADSTKTATAIVTVTAPVLISVSITNINPAVVIGSTLQFAAQVAGTGNQSVTWSVQEGNGGSITSSGGLYTPPTVVGTFHVVATSVVDPTKSASAAVVVTAPPAITVTITPPSASVQVGKTLTFQATVTNASNKTVQWTLQEASGGTIDSSGVYTAPATAGTFHVIATSAADMTASATAAVTVTSAPVVNVTISPLAPSILAGNTGQFNASASGGASAAVTYSVTESGGGSIDSAGLYTAPATAGTYHVVATSVSDPTARAQATVTVFQTPATPTVTASASCLQITLTWPQSANATSYTVARAPAGSTTFTLVSSSAHAPAQLNGQWAFTDTVPSNAAQFNYQVAGVNPVATGQAGTASATSGLVAPPLKTFPGDTQVSLIWGGVAFPPDATFVVERSGGSGPVRVSPSGLTFTSMTDISAAVSQTYSYSVYAVEKGTPGCPAQASAVTGAGNTSITQSRVAQYTSIAGDGRGGVVETTVVWGLGFLHDRSCFAVSLDRNGVPTSHPCAGTADGYFTIPNVPAGRNYLRLGSFRGYTPLRQFDLSFASNARADGTTPGGPTNVTTSVSGLVPFTAGDLLELTVLGQGANADLISNASAGAPAAGANSASLVDDFNNIYGYGFPLIDTSKGDTLWLTDVANVAGASTPYTSLQKYCPATVTPSPMVDQQPATIACAGGSALQAVTQATATLDWKASQFVAAVQAGAASGTFFSSYFSISGFQNAAKYGVQFFGPSLMSMGLPAATSGDVNQPITYGNPFSANYDPFLNTGSQDTVAVTAAATASCPSPGAGTLYLGSFLYQSVSALSGGIAPLVQPPTGVNSSPASADITDPLFGTGKPVTISWTAPTTGNAPVAYSVFVYGLAPTDAPATPCAGTDATYLGRYWSLDAVPSVVLPPSLFATNDGSQAYSVIVRAYYWDNTIDPSKVLQLFGGRTRAAAETFGGTFKH